LGAIFDGAVFSTSRSHSEAIRRKRDQIIKMWRFLEGVSSPSAVKKGEAEAGTLYASRCDVL